MDLDGPRERFSRNPDLVMPAASLAKMPILVTLCHQIARDDNPYTWRTRLEVSDEVRVTSDGVLADLSSELRPTLHDLAHLMITVSDNSAANMLLDLLGMETVNATMCELGLQHTHLERRFMDFEARRAGRENWTCASDMLLLFAQLLSQDMPERARLLHILLRQNDRQILSAYWGEDKLFAHKTGSLEGILHDVGILLRFPDDSEPLLIAALTANQADLPLTRLVLARAGRSLRQSWLNAD